MLMNTFCVKGGNGNDLVLNQVRETTKSSQLWSLQVIAKSSHQRKMLPLKNQLILDQTCLPMTRDDLLILNQIF